VSVPGPFARSFASFEVQSLSERTTVAGTTVSGAAIAYLTMNAPVTQSIEIVGAIRNLFDTTYADPASDEHQLDAIAQNGRTLSVGVRWHFSK
jgi:outer membrane receptor protein involved in Fe transport